VYPPIRSRVARFLAICLLAVADLTGIVERAEALPSPDGHFVAITPSPTLSPTHPIGFVLPAMITVREGPQASSPPRGTLRGGDVVTLTGRDASGEWLQIVYPAETEGRAWVRAREVETFGASAGLPVIGDAGALPTPPASATPTRQAPSSGPVGRLVLETASGGDIYLVNADGSGLHRLTDGLDPALSPDGHFVAFARWREPYGLYLLDLKTGEERRLFAANRVRTPAWSPDGASIIFSHETGGTAAQQICIPRLGCFTIPAQTYRRLGRVWPADGTFRDVPSDLQSISPTWSPDGERFAYRGDRGIRLAKTDGDSKLLREDTRIMSPSWSPDGRYLAVQVRQHDHWDIFLLDVDTGGLIPLTGSPALAERKANNVAPAWSPDGRHIIFVTDRSGRWEIYIMNRDGSGQRPLFPRGLPGVALQYDYAAERMVSWAR
jgi:Tol biopolymer transport system component